MYGNNMKLNIEVDGFTTRVFVGDSQIGMIQKMAFRSSINDLPYLEVQFPDIPGMSDEMKSQIEGYKDLLKPIQYVKVI
jgi:hypothetical protein